MSIGSGASSRASASALRATRTAVVGLIMLVLLLTLVIFCDSFFNYQGEVIKQHMKLRLRVPER